MPEPNETETDVQNRAVVEALRAEFRRLEAQLAWEDEPAVTYRLQLPSSDDDR